MGTRRSVEAAGVAGGTYASGAGVTAEGVAGDAITARTAPATFFTTTFSVGDATSSSATSGDSLAIWITARIWSKSSFGSVTIASRGQVLYDPPHATVLLIPPVK